MGYDTTPFKQILKQNAKREMRLRLGKVTVADVLAAQPVTFFFSSRRRHTRCSRDWSSDVCSSDLESPARSHATQQVAFGVEGIHEAMTLAGDVVVLVGVLKRVGYVDRAPQEPDSEGGVTRRKVGVGEPAQQLMEPGVEHVHGTRVEVGGVETVAGCGARDGQALIDRTPGREIGRASCRERV